MAPPTVGTTGLAAAQSSAPTVIPVTCIISSTQNIGGKYGAALLLKHGNIEDEVTLDVTLKYFKGPAD